MNGCETAMGKVSGNTHTQKQLNNYANQYNSNNPAYRANNNNHANQLNPNHAQAQKGKWETIKTVAIMAKGRTR